MNRLIKKKNVLLLGMLVYLFSAQAQEPNNPDGFLNSGGSSFLEEALIASVGEPVTGLNSEGAFHWMQGFVYKVIEKDFKTDVYNLELASQLEVSVYPNPASEYLHVEFKNTTMFHFNYAITSLTGSKVKSGILHGNLTSINVSDIVYAPYILSVYSDESTDVLYQTLFIKQ